MTLLLCGCAQFDEVHYFKSERRSTGETTNYFRLHVSGNAGFSSARYVAGYYDERAVDMFFNELKSGGTTTTPNVLFPDTLKSPGSDEKITPLDPGKNGVFVMILSTNADAVANTIGSFGENAVVSDAITNLVNRDQIRAANRSKAETQVLKTRAAAVAAELTALFDAVAPNPPTVPSAAAANAAYLRILNAIAAALSGGGAARPPQTPFADSDAAAKWYNDLRQGSGTSP